MNLFEGDVLWPGMTIIRPAHSFDSDELQALFERFIRESEWLPKGATDKADFATTTAEERIFVAVSEAGQLVGAVTVWEPESFIHWLFVDSSCQGQGIGTRLLQSLRPWLPYPWKLKCLATNRRALEFYRRRGWVKLETGIGDQGTYFVLVKEGDDSRLD